MSTRFTYVTTIKAPAELSDYDAESYINRKLFELAGKYPTDIPKCEKISYVRYESSHIVRVAFESLQRYPAVEKARQTNSDRHKVQPKEVASSSKPSQQTNGAGKEALPVGAQKSNAKAKAKSQASKSTTKVQRSK